MWVRGLKQVVFYKRDEIVQSHPVWVRGLKHVNIAVPDLDEKVAPRVGAWIETVVVHRNSHAWLGSHPVWVRGLKHYIRSVT